MKPLCGILLAAGEGQRFGSNKLLHPLADGKPLLLHGLHRLKAAMPRTVVVVNAADGKVKALLAHEGVEVVENPDSQEGMGGSIACGVRACTEAGGWVIALADMPYLRIKTIMSVAQGLRDRHSICAPLHEGQRGHPVGFGAAYVEALMQLHGEDGARHIIRDNHRHLKLFETSDPGVITDIDYPDDL